MSTYTPQWFHKIICNEADKIISGESKRLMVFTAAQNGKTEHTTRRLISYAHGKNPNLKLALCCYSATKAEQYHREIQNIIDSPSYREVFPNTTLAGTNARSGTGKWKRAADEYEVVGYRGRLKSVGIGGGLSGDPVDGAIIDDPIKDYIEAYSPVYRERLWNWYISVLLKRLHNDSFIIYTCTRWHEDDLAGRLLKIEPEKWRVLIIPALCEPLSSYYKFYPKESIVNYIDPRKEGESLWEKKHSRQSYLESKGLSLRLHEAMDQQRPAPTEGGLFKQQWFRYYHQMPMRFDRIIQSWDCTFKDTKDSDFVVCTIWGKVGADSYLLGYARGQWDFVETIRQIRLVNSKYPYCQEKLVEDKANGSAVIATLKKEIPGLVPIEPLESKESRAYAVSFIFESGNVYFPANCPWVQEIEQELKVFNHGAHDDIVDSITQALRWLYLKHVTKLLHLGSN
jgi:predicted phage terminase large subunit-like protein